MIKQNRQHLEIGKWKFHFSVSRDFMRMDDFSRVITVMAVKPHQKPPEMTELRKGDYKGLYFRMRVWIPVTIDRWK